jgi:hypothetical protein
LNFKFDFLQVYDSKAEIVANAPAVINKGDGAIIEVEAYITEPASLLTFVVYQPLGYEVSLKDDWVLIVDPS